MVITELSIENVKRLQALRSVAIEGHLAEERVRESLIGLKRVCADVRFLGSYPRADGQRGLVDPGMRDGDFVAAREWIDALGG